MGKQMWVDQRLAAGEAQMLQSQAVEDLENALQLIGSQVVLVFEEGCTRCRATVLATEIAVLGQGEAQITDAATEAIPQTSRCTIITVQG